MGERGQIKLGKSRRRGAEVPVECLYGESIGNGDINTNYS